MTNLFQIAIAGGVVLILNDLYTNFIDAMATVQSVLTSIH